jgi:hypothetical protein
MIRLTHVFAFAVLWLGVANSSVAQDGPSREIQACIAQAQGPYGFQCHGSAFNGSFFEPVTFVGTVEADRHAVYEGFGTFSSSNGSVSAHVKGQATFGKNCFGRVEYTTNEILLAGGGVIPLLPVTFDFTVVDGGKEILGTGVAPAGVTGDFVPRLTCRLVKIGAELSQRSSNLP